MLYAARHVTRHLYQSPATQCVNELRLTPRVLPGQWVRESNIRVKPEAPLWRRRDYFGNDVATVSLFEPHEEFVIEATSLVEVQPIRRDNGTCLSSAGGAAGAPALASAGARISWEDAREQIASHHDPATLDALEYVFDSPFVPRANELAEYARPSFSQRRSLLDALSELSSRIYCEFRYRPKSTTIDMPLLHVLRNRQGVCQDFAHVMIGALRSLGLAARYVSGYLRSSANYQGAEASHAWVSAFIPGSGWMSFDPTNNVMPAEGHITLAWGRDYGDVAPVKGITVGGGNQTIEVEVRVEPIEES